MAKVRFGIKNVHYAVLTEGSTPSWGTPTPLPGAVSLDLSQEGGRENFYADNTTYYVSFSDNGYSGDLELARVPEEFLEDIFGMTKDTKDVIIEDSKTEPKPFALLFETDLDDGVEKICLYRCVADRPNVGSSTIEETKTPQTQTISISAIPVINGDLDGKVMAKTTADTPDATLEAWYTTVYQPA